MSILSVGVEFLGAEELASTTKTQGNQILTMITFPIYLFISRSNASDFLTSPQTLQKFITPAEAVSDSGGFWDAPIGL